MERESLIDEAGRRGSGRLIEFSSVPLINVYMAGDVLIDTGRSWDKRRILKQGLGAERGARGTPRRRGRADMEMRSRAATAGEAIRRAARWA